MRTREIDGELVDIWAVMLGEKIDQAREKLLKTRRFNEYIGLGAYIDGIAYAMALMSSLEKGRFEKDYERLRMEVRGL